MDPDSVSLNESALSDGKKSSISDWRSKLASKFKNSGPGKDTYNVADASSYDSFSPSGNSSYRRMSDEAEPASHLGPGGVGAPNHVQYTATYIYTHTASHHAATT